MNLVRPLITRTNSLLDVQKKQVDSPTLFLINLGASSDMGKAILFNKYLNSMFIRRKDNLPPIDFLFTPSNVLNNNDGSRVVAILSSLHTSRSTCPDGFRPKFLKSCALAIYLPITHLFSLCLSQHHLPNDWRVHSIIIIYKLGDKFSVTNDRASH